MRNIVIGTMVHLNLTGLFFITRQWLIPAFSTIVESESNAISIRHRRSLGNSQVVLFSGDDPTQGKSDSVTDQLSQLVHIPAQGCETTLTMEIRSRLKKKLLNLF
jgi:hypothetical protein